MALVCGAQRQKQTNKQISGSGLCESESDPSRSARSKGARNCEATETESAHNI